MTDMATDSANPTAMMLRRLVDKCSVCKEDLSKHQFAVIATTVATKNNILRVQEVLEHVRQHRWGELAGYKDFRGDQNAVVVYAITGQHNGGMVILTRDPHELYETAEIYLQEHLSQEEVSAVAGLVGTEVWRDF
jgi:hypothetical protein